jgi:hypothetical protein
MFSTEELDAIDRKYFTVVVADAYDVTLISNNTKHVWYLHNAEMQESDVTLIFHKHRVSHPYHEHGRCRTLGRAIKQIKMHDEFQLNGRKPIHSH